MIKLMTAQESLEAFEDAVAKIRAGELVDIVDASSCAYAVCIGDFRANDWAEKIVTRNSMWWHWTGPNAIRVSGKIVQPNSYTEEIDMDWS